MCAIYTNMILRLIWILCLKTAGRSLLSFPNQHLSTTYTSYPILPCLPVYFNHTWSLYPAINHVSSWTCHAPAFSMITKIPAKSSHWKQQIIRIIPFQPGLITCWISGKWHLEEIREAMKIFKLKSQERSGLRGKGHSSNLGSYLDEIMDPEFSLIIVWEPRSRPESPPYTGLSKINDSRPLTNIFKLTVIRP